MSLMQLGLVRGLVGQALGMVIGIAIVLILRLAAGMTPVWLDDPVWVAGAVLGVIGFMIGVGSMDDWGKWMRGIETCASIVPCVVGRTLNISKISDSDRPAVERAPEMPEVSERDLLNAAGSDRMSAPSGAVERGGRDALATRSTGD